MKVSQKRNNLANCFDLSARTIIDQKFGERSVHKYIPLLPADKIKVSLTPNLHCTGTYIKPFFGDSDVVFSAFQVSASQLWKYYNDWKKRVKGNLNTEPDFYLPHIGAWMLNRTFAFSGHGLATTETISIPSSVTSVGSLYKYLSSTYDFFPIDTKSDSNFNKDTVFSSEVSTKTIDGTVYYFPKKGCKLTSKGKILYQSIQAIDNIQFAAPLSYDATRLYDATHLAFYSPIYNFLPIVALASITYYYFMQQENKNASVLKFALDSIYSFEWDSFNSKNIFGQVWNSSSNMITLMFQYIGNYMPFVHRHGSLLSDMRDSRQNADQKDMNSNNTLTLDQSLDPNRIDSDIYTEVNSTYGAAMNGGSPVFNANQISILLRMKKFATRCRVAGISSLQRFRAMFGVDEVNPFVPILLKTQSFPLSRTVTTATDSAGLGTEQAKQSPLSGSFSFSAESSTDSYIFIICHLLPNQRLYQGLGASITELTQNALPNSMLDGFGMVAVPYTQLLFESVPSAPNTHSENSVAGYIPRFDEWRRGQSMVLGDMRKPNFEVWHNGFRINELLQPFGGNIIAESDAIAYQEISNHQMQRLFVNSDSRFVICDDFHIKVLRNLTSFSQALELEDGEDTYNAFGETNQF